MGFNSNRRSYGKLGTRAPMWAQTAVGVRKMVPVLDGRYATANLSDWHLLALWAAWKGSKLRTGEEGQQLIADLESGWRDYKAWLWSRFGL
jgi:hypothetical protein